MKKILLIIATMISSESLLAVEGKNEITDSFRDTVKTISEGEKEIVVQFSRHSAIYKVSKDHPRYEEIKTKLEKLKKEEKKAKVVAVIPKMEIKDIAE